MYLEKIKSEELSEIETKQINGGGLVGIAIHAFLLGRRVEYVKNGGGFFDFYL